MKTVLITGGSSGIGLEISKRFANNGFNICWVTILEDEIHEAKKELLAEQPDVSINYLIQDLSTEDGAQKTYDWVISNGFDVDVFINNAGFATYGMSTEIPIEKEVNMLKLNVLAVYKLTRIFLKYMNQRAKGTIINISSNSSFSPVPRMAAYAATKAFVSHYSQGLQLELEEQKSNVKIITICPAAIFDTKFKVKANMENVKTFEGLQATTKAEVADDVWKAYSKGITYYMTGSKLRRSNWLTQILPKSLLYKLMRQELSEK